MADLAVTQCVPGNTARTRPRKAGATLAAGDAVCRDLTLPYAGAVNKSDANASEARSRVTGLVTAAAAAGVTVEEVFEGAVDVGVATAKGVPYFASANPGKICPAGDLVSGMYTTLVGFGMGGTLLYVKPLASGIFV